MKTLLIAVMLSAPAFAGDVKSELTAQMTKWATDFNAHDPQALAKHYTDDVQFIYAFAGQEGQSKKAIEQFYVQSFKATPDIAAKMISYELTPISDTIVYGAGLWEDSFTGPDGKKLTVPTHSSEIFVKKNGRWMVRVDHASFVPPPQPAAKEAGH